MADLYSIVKTLHIITAAILLGTGLGIAWFMFLAQRSPEFAVRRFGARATVNADLYVTLPAVILQPLTGAWLIWRAGWPAFGALILVFVLMVTKHHGEARIDHRRLRQFRQLHCSLARRGS